MSYDFPDPITEPHDHCRDGSLVLARMILKVDPSFHYMGCFNYRDINGSDQLSLHAVGRAIDIGIDTASPQSKTKMDETTRALVHHFGGPVIQQIIWYRMVWNADKGWHDFNGASGPHTDHAHIELTKWGADNPDLWVPEEWLDQIGMEEEEMRQEDYEGIADAIWNKSIETTYTHEDGSTEQVDITFGQFIGNAQILLDRIARNTADD